MTRTCTIRTHEKRQEIDKALAEGQPYRGISRTFRVSEDALARHKEAHLPAKIARAAEAKEVREAVSLLDRLEVLKERTLRALDKAEAGGDLRVVLAAVREARENVRLTSELTGELQKAGLTVNVQTNVAVSEDNSDSDRMGAILEILIQSGVLPGTVQAVAPSQETTGQTEDQDPGPDQGQSADEAPLLATGTVTETVTPVTVTQGTQGKAVEEEFLLDPADPNQILSLARQCGFPRLPLRRGGVIPAGEPEWRQFLPGCSSQTLQHIAESLAALASSRGIRVRIISGAAQGAEAPPTNEVDSRVVFSLLARLGWPPIELPNGRRIAAGEPNWQRALNEADGETWRLALEALEALDAALDDPLTDVGRMFAFARRSRFQQTVLRDGRTIPEGEVGWRQSLAGADRGTLRLVLEALGMRWGAGDDERF